MADSKNSFIKKWLASAKWMPYRQDFFSRCSNKMNMEEHTKHPKVTRTDSASSSDSDSSGPISPGSLPRSKTEWLFMLGTMLATFFRKFCASKIRHSKQLHAQAPTPDLK